MSYEFDWSVLWRYREALAEGFALTLALSLLGLSGALALGIVAGTAGTGTRRGARLAAAYVEIARNVPLLVHMYFWYLGLTALRLPAFWCGVLALAIYSGAYVAEIVRAGIQSVPAGQWAAALASGLSPRQTLLHVIYPQALRIVAPSLAGLLSQLIKDSSLASVISVGELTFAAGAIEGETFRTFEAYIGITVLYLVTVTLISQLVLRPLRGRAVDPAMRF
ncbi:MAG TPA: amino acid ABC transporter permease [Stellaceae bacterium]|nr:amino acid ABC transporter permease [Stellaceae bacterium]